MKRENEVLRGLVDHLSQAWHEENAQRGGGSSTKPVSRGPSAAHRSEPSGLDPVSQSSNAWTWQDWAIDSLFGGMNGRVFRASGSAGDVAVKFTVRDKRDRAGREWAALTIMAEKSASLAPKPLLLDRDRYPQQVIVQSWVEGESSDAAPETDAAWKALSRHLLEIHSLPIGPGHSAIRPVVMTVNSAADLLRAISFQHSCLPRIKWPQAVNDLVDRAHALSWPSWPNPPLRFCRGDPNIRNFIRRPLSWGSVDWEYSGWGDPAFELADFLVHANHIAWPRRQTRRLVDLYSDQSSDTAIRERIAVYESLMLIWWTLRLGRFLLEARPGRDKRLVESSQSWYQERLELHKRYRQLASDALDSRNAFL